MRVALARIARVCLAAATLAAAAGCGGEGSKITRTGSKPLEQRADGKLTRQPDPLSVADLDRYPDDAVQSVILRIWFYGQWGSAPSIVRFYDQRVIREVGASQIAGAYTQLRGEMLDSRPRIRSAVRIPGGTLVTVDLLTAAAPPRPESLLLRRQGKIWHIIYDSFLAGGLAGYVQSQTQARVAPRNTTPAPQAIAAGAAAADRYRRVFLTDLSGAGPG